MDEGTVSTEAYTMEYIRTIINDEPTAELIFAALNVGKERPPTGQLADSGYYRESSWYAPGLGMLKNGRLDYDTIDRMFLNGQIAFAYAMKIAPLVSRFRNRETWRFRSSDPVLAAKATALKRYLFFSIADMVTCARYGVFFAEQVWALHTAQELALDDSKIAPTDKVWVPEPVIPIHPKAVLRVLYTEPTETQPKQFNGFEVLRSDGKKVVIDRERALVLTHNKRFKDIFGESLLEPAYVYWYFYDQLWRAAMKYYERIGQPVVVVHYPSRETYTLNGKTISAADYAIELGQNAVKKTVLAVPSDREFSIQGTSGSEPKWRIEFLSESFSSDAGQMFDTALSRLEAQIQRSMILADRVATQDSKYGSYALAEVHEDVTTEDTETRLLELIAQIERYVLTKFAKYNGADASATLYVEVDPLDNQANQQLRAVLSTLLNVHPQMEEIDMRALGEQIGIPFMSEAQMNALQKRKIKNATNMLEATAKVSAKEEVPVNKVNGAPKQVANKKGTPTDNKNAKKALSLVESMVQSGIEHYVDEGTGSWIFDVPESLVQDFLGGILGNTDQNT